MPHLEEGEIHAWLDGAVDEAEAGRIEAHVTSCERCAAEVATARGLIAGASRILLSLDSVPAGVIPRQDMKRPLQRHSPWLSRPWVRIAASLMLVAGVGVVATRDQRSADDQVRIEFKTATVGSDSAASSGPGPETPPMSTGTPASADAAEGQRDVVRSEAAANPAVVTPSRGPTPLPDRLGPLPASVAQVGPKPTAPGTTAPPPPLVADASRAEANSLAGAAGDMVLRRVERDSAQATSRLSSEVIVTGAAAGAQVGAAPTAGSARNAAPLQLRPSVPGASGLGGACFALDARSAPGSAGIPLVPTRMRIRLANAPTDPPMVALEERLRRTEASTADVQAGAAASRQAAAPAPRAYAAPTSEPAEPLPWLTAAADSVVAYWGTATDVVVFRLHVSGERVNGIAAAQMAPDRPSTIEGRRVLCGGG